MATSSTSSSMYKKFPIRRLICALFALCLCLTLGMSAMAAPYGDISALFQHWEQFGYPEDVAGVYSTDGSAYNLTVQLIGDEDGSREAEIRGMLDDDSGVHFEAGTYSHARLLQIHQEITDGYMSEGSGVYACGIGWGMDGGFGESGKESRVVVTVDEARLGEYTEALSGIYGEAVVVEAGEQPTFDTEQAPALITVQSAEQSSSVGFTLATVLMIAGGILVVVSGIVVLWSMKKK